MIVFDSSMWIAFFNGTNNGKKVREKLNNNVSTVIPAICIYEVFKIINRQIDKSAAETSVSFMKSFGEVINIDYQISLSASYINAEFKLPMADSLIYATGLANEAEIWTQDSDFKNLSGVRFFKKE